MNKHAYLIIAHKTDLTLYTLIKLLDAPENDFYIHMDVKNTGFCTENLKTVYSSLHFTERTSVTWGGYSQINAEMILLKEAIHGHYSYYHLLSGSDLPVKKHNEIYDFFECSNNSIFIDFMDNKSDNHSFRTGQYHLFQESLGRNYQFFFNRCFLKLQRILHIHRNADTRFGKGANWFSITDDFAQYVVSQEAWIRKTFKYTFCCDEVFLQTVLLCSPFIDKLYYKGFDNNPRANMREVDWKRGSPYVFRTDDFDILMQSEMMFARKFDSDVDSKIIQQIYESLVGDEYAR